MLIPQTFWGSKEQNRPPSEAEKVILFLDGRLLQNIIKRKQAERNMGIYSSNFRFMLKKVG